MQQGCAAASLTCASAIAGTWHPHWAMAWLRAAAAAMAKSEGTQAVWQGLTKATGELQQMGTGGMGRGGVGGQGRNDLKVCQVSR